MRCSPAVIAALILSGCGSSAPEKSAEMKAQTPAPPAVKDNTAKLPSANRSSARVEQNHILDNSALPGGTLGEYEKNGKKYQMFIVETATPQDAAILLLDVKNTMKNPAYIASFGGYFGTGSSGDLFVFAKGKYLAGVAGLGQPIADPIARQLAAGL